MLILGIDPGTTTTGYGLIELDMNRSELDLIVAKTLKIDENVSWAKRFESFYDDFTVVDYGLIETEKNQYAPTKYAKIYKDFMKSLDKHQPDVMAIEKIFFATNALTAISVGQAQGVMFLAAAHHNLPVIEYAPGTIKKVVTGSGRAKKKEVEAAVKEILGSIQGAKVKVDKERGITKTHIDNAVDALAIALCHVFHMFDVTLKKHNEAVNASFQSRVLINGKL